MPGISYIPQGETSFDRALKATGLLTNMYNDLQRTRNENLLAASRLKLEDIQAQTATMNQALLQRYGDREASARVLGLENANKAAEVGYERQRVALEGDRITNAQQQFNLDNINEIYQTNLDRTIAGTAGLRAETQSRETNTDIDQYKLKKQQELDAIIKASPDIIANQYKQAREAAGMPIDDRQAQQMATIYGPALVEQAQELNKLVIQEKFKQNQLHAESTLRSGNAFLSVYADGKPGTEELAQLLADQSENPGYKKLAAEADFSSGLTAEMVQNAMKKPDTALAVWGVLNRKGLVGAVPIKETPGGTSPDGKTVIFPSKKPDTEAMNEVVDTVIVPMLNRSKVARKAGVRVDESGTEQTKSTTQPAANPVSSSAGKGQNIGPIRQVNKTTNTTSMGAALPGLGLYPTVNSSVPSTATGYEITVDGVDYPVVSSASDLANLPGPPGTPYWHKGLGRIAYK